MVKGDVCLYLQILRIVLSEHADGHIGGLLFKEVPVLRASDYTHHIPFVCVLTLILELKDLFAQTTFGFW